MKKSKRIISLLLSVLMLMSAMQAGFVAFAADGTSEITVLSSTEAASIPNAGAVATATQVVRVASGPNSYELGTAIVAATPSGIPAMSSDAENSNSIANGGDVNETAEYPVVKITFEDLPDGIPQIKCVNANAATNNVLFSAPVYNEADKSYTWNVLSGTATAGDVLQYKITYTYEGQQYVSSAYSFVENIIQPAGTYAQTTSTYKSGLFGWGDAYRARVNAVTRVIGINTYSSLDSFTTSSTDYRGYYNADADTFLMRSGTAYSTYAVVRGEETTTENDNIQYLLNDRRSYADVYVDSSVTNSFADLNLRYAVTMSTSYTEPQTLEYVAVVKGSQNAGGGYIGTDDIVASTTAGEMTPKTQYVSTFSGRTFEDGQEYTILTQITSSNDGAANTTAFPVGLRVHVTDKGALRSTIENILHNNSPETPLTTAANKGIDPQSWYYSEGFEAYEAAMLDAQEVLNNPRATQTEIDNAVTSLNTAYNGLVLKEADYSSVEEAKTAAQAYIDDADVYTTDSINVLIDSISTYDASTDTGTIQYGYSVIYQPQVELWAENIYKAIEELEYRLADYDELNEAYAKAQELQEHKDDFFDFSAVEAAMKAVDFNVKITEQEKVDEMTANLNTAIGNLKYKLADYTAVNEAVTRAQSYIASNYTEESFQALRTVLRNIDYSLDLSQQETVDGYVTQINEAIDNLDELDADYTALEELLNEVENLVEEYYYPETYANAKQVAETCAGYKDIKITQQAQVDEMTANLQAAVDALVMYDADYTLVDEQIARYQNMDTTQMTEASKLAVENAIANIKRELKIDEQTLVDAYYTELKLAIDSLAYMPADYSRVELALERASQVDRTYWSQETIQLLDNAVDSVIYGLGVNKQDDIDKMADDINAAIDGLKPGPADYSDVNDAIASFEALNQSYYTADSLAKVQAAINAVNWNLTKDREAEVVRYAVNIQKAMLELEEAKADYTELLNIVNTMPTSGDDYTTESYKDMNTVYNGINWQLSAKDQDVVIGYQNALLEAIANLKYRTGDYTDVDAAIAEGRAIIAKNDPPISDESVEAFEAFVAGINRTYTIKQTSEIAALASQIRAEYAKFTYAESIHKAAIRLESDKSATYPGDTISVSVYIKTDYYAASSSIPVLYDSTFYELVGTDVASAFQFEGSYAESSKQEGNINSPSKAYPSSYTDTEKAQWKIALFSLAPLSENNPYAQTLDPEQKVATIQFKVRDDISVGTSNSFNGKVWIDSRFQKTEENKLGKLYIGRFETEMVNNDVVPMGQTIDVSAAEINVSILNPDAGANFSELTKALITYVPEYAAEYYVEDTYTNYSAAKAVADDIMDNQDSYTVKEQKVVDDATKALIAAYNALVLTPADTSALENAVALVPANPVDYYTEDSYKAFTDAVKTGEEILAETGLTVAEDQARIDAAAETIENAYNALTIKPFTFEAQMETALSKSPAYDSTFYTEETYQAYLDAYEALENFKASNPTFINDNEGSILIYNLNTAYSNLKLDDADTSLLEAEIAKGTEYDSSFYTEDTYAVYEAAIEDGNEILNSTDRLTTADNERINDAADAIAAARDALEFKPFSYTTEVTAALSNRPSLSQSSYTTDSYAAYKSAYNALYAFRRQSDKDIRNDAEALQLIKDLEDALNNLKELPADTTLLDEALALEVLDEEYYTEDSYAPYETALNAVKEYGDDYYWKLSEQETLDALAQAIIDAHAELEIKPFTKLQDLVDAIAVGPEDPKDYYTEKAYAEYLAAKSAIEDKIAEANAGKLDMTDDADAVALIDAYNEKLEALKSAYVPADYSDVENAIAEAGEYDRDLYKNFEIVDEAINNVVEGLKKSEQETVDAYAAAIREAISNLKRKDAIILKEDATAYITETGYIRGLSYINSASDITNLFEIYGDAEIIITPADVIDYDSFTVEYYGTGTLVEFVIDGEVTESYTIVIDGDINGDGVADTIDITELATYINKFKEPSLACQKAAVDLCEDGYLDAIDLTIVISIVNMS